MICPYPKEVGGKGQQGKTLVTVDCGKCHHCLVNDRRQKVARLILEQEYQRRRGLGSAFVTLTYETNPPGGSLRKADLDAWAKRYRRAAEPLRVRLAKAGEYGTRSGRPHYHVLLMGTPDLLEVEQAVKQTWPHGFVQVGECTAQTIAYVAGYVTKKLKHAADPRFEGLEPEFFSWSTRPAMGKAFVDIFLDRYYSKPSVRQLVELQGDINTEFRYQGARYPLGRTFCRWLREGWNERYPDSQISLDAETRGYLHPWDQEAYDPSARVENYARLRKAERARCLAAERRVGGL